MVQSQVASPSPRDAKPWRRRAKAADTRMRCSVCEKYFVLDEKIFFSHLGRPVHVYRCRIKYWAAYMLFKGWSHRELISEVGLKRRTAFRVQAVARMILEGEIQ